MTNYTRPLSPATEAVLDAFMGERVGTLWNRPWPRPEVAAALRALADQVASPFPDDCTADVFNRQLKIRSEVLAIADELEGRADG
jgi:hypothetical protein